MSSQKKTTEQQCKSFSPQPRWAASVVCDSGLVWYQECDSYSSFPENVCAWCFLMLWYLPQSTSCEALPSSWVDFLLECYWLLSLLHVHIFLVFYFPRIYFSTTQWTEGWNQPFSLLWLWASLRHHTGSVAQHLWRYHIPGNEGIKDSLQSSPKQVTVSCKSVKKCWSNNDPNSVCN